jgi:hypothetical protein
MASQAAAAILPPHSANRYNARCNIVVGNHLRGTIISHQRTGRTGPHQLAAGFSVRGVVGWRYGSQSANCVLGCVRYCLSAVGRVVGAEPLAARFDMARNTSSLARDSDAHTLLVPQRHDFLGT